MKVLGLVLILGAVAFAKYEEYSEWKSYYLKPTTREQLQFIRSITAAYEIDVLGHPIVGREGVVLVKPQHQAAFLKALEDHGVSYRIHRRNVKEALEVDYENIQARKNQTRARNARQLPFDNYHELDVIYEYLENIAARYPETVTLVEPTTTSYQGTTIKYLKISTTNFEDESKPVIFIDGGIHAREWISPAAVTYFINKLVEDVTEPDLLERFDWIIHPVVNPDGYEYTFRPYQILEARFWRKTRSMNPPPIGLLCRGTDGNRNFDVHFNEIGTEPEYCSEIYAGSHAFSEPETRIVRDIIHEYLHRMALYITVHSYGSMILYPWGDGTLPINAFALHTVGVAMAQAIEKDQLSHFPKYVVGNSQLVLDYATSGSSEDYAYAVGVPLSYTYELPGFNEEYEVEKTYDDYVSVDDTINGFHLDPKYIERVCKDTWEGIIVGARRAGDLYTPLP